MISETIRVETDVLLVILNSSYRLGKKDNKQKFRMTVPGGDKVVAEAEFPEAEEQILDQVFQFTIQGVNNSGELQKAELQMNLSDLSLLGTTIGKILQNNGIYVR